MTAGGRRFEHRLEFSSPTQIVEGGGSTEDGTFTAEFKRRGEYKRSRGQERVEAQQQSDITPTFIKVRADSKTRTIKNGWQVADLDRVETFIIHDVVQTNDKKWIEMICQSGGGIG